MESLHVLVLHLRTSRPHDPAFQDELDALNVSAVQAVHATGAVAELVAAAEVAPADLDQALERAGAVVVMGGEDVHPAFYAGPAHYPSQGHHDAEGDAAQLRAIRRCWDEGKPLLGICRGHQLLNVAAGGTLVQHLPGDPHRGTGADPFVGTSLVVAEELRQHVDPDRQVRCTHHQAIDRLGGGLRVVATSADGVIEAVVGVERPVTGVQWHPEHPGAALESMGPLLRRLTDQAMSSLRSSCVELKRAPLPATI